MQVKQRSGKESVFGTEEAYKKCGVVIRTFCCTTGGQEDAWDERKALGRRGRRLGGEKVRGRTGRRLY